MVAELETLLSQGPLRVTSPEKVRNLKTGDWVWVDVSVRGRVGSADVFVVMECRDRVGKQGIGWIRELVTRQAEISANKLIAVSRDGFTGDAERLAAAEGIEIRTLLRFTGAEVAQSVLAVRLQVMVPAYNVTGVQVAVTPAVIRLGDAMPEIPSDLIGDMTKDPDAKVLLDLKEHKMTCFRNLVQSAEWAAAFSSISPGSPRETRTVDVDVMRDDQGFRRKRLEFPLPSIPEGKMLFLSRLELVAELRFEPREVTLSGLRRYETPEGVVAEISEFDLAPHGLIGKTIEILLLPAR